MKKAMIIVFLFLAVFFVGIFIGRGTLTARVIEENVYSWTKAICNSDNECMDFYIACKNGNVKKIDPVSKVVKLDFIPENLSDKLC